MRLRPAIVIGLLALSGFAPDSPAIWAGIKSGPHAVGVTRSVSGGLEVTLWYPGSPGGRMARLRDLSNQASGLVEVLVGSGLSEKAANGYVDTALLSRWDAPRENGKWPLVLVGQGNLHDALNQAVLCEIIASHGFAVATVPSPTIKTPMQSADDVGPVAQRQAEDLLAAVTALSSATEVDTSRIAVVGHSFGARAALLLAMHDQRVKALVSLDGGIGTSTAMDSFKKAAWFSPSRATAPILHFYETVDPAMTPDFTLLRSLPSRELVLLELKGLQHPHFATTGFQSAIDPSWRRLTGMTPEGPQSLVTMMETVVSFLRAKS